MTSPLVSYQYLVLRCAPRASLETAGAICHGEPGPGRPLLPSLGQCFGWLAEPRSTVTQPGPVHGGLTRDPPAEAWAAPDPPGRLIVILAPPSNRAAIRQVMRELSWVWGCQRCLAG